MEKFTNETLDLPQLPQYEQTALNPIMPSYWKVIRFNFIATMLVLAVIVAFLYIRENETLSFTAWWLVLVSMALLMAVLLFALKIGFNKRGYAIREHDIIYQKGILSTTSMIIPYQRIQHIAINEGYLSRHYGLAQLQIFTAGSSASDLKIAGLSKENAERIKEQILRQISPVDPEILQAPSELES